MAGTLPRADIGAPGRGTWDSAAARTARCLASAARTCNHGGETAVAEDQSPLGDDVAAFVSFRFGVFSLED